MNANENLEKRENAIVRVVSGVALMSIGIISFICIYYAVLIPTLQGKAMPYNPEVIISAFYIGIGIGTVGLVCGFLLLLLGLLSFVLLLLGRLKKTGKSLIMRCRLTIEEVFVMPFLELKRRISW
jgi:hypothetical protein